MTVLELISKKRKETVIYRNDFIDVSASPLWKAKPGHGQTWRHSCLLCGEILLDDTSIYDITDSAWAAFLQATFLRSIL